MGQTKLCLTAADLSRARQLSDRLGEAWEPAAHAVTLFEVAGTPNWEVEAYYDGEPDPQALRELLADLLDTTTQWRLEAVPDENWVAISQAALPPVTAGRFVVHGSHDRAAIGFRLNAIEIDAGEAFGTAHHATTRGCLEALDRISRSQRFERVLDLGCGSGVLAIAARRLLPAARITASDIDPEAVRVARGNARTNRAGRSIKIVTSVGFDSPALRNRFDLVLANILAGPLIRLAPAMRVALRPKGLAVLSGILSDQSEEVEAAYRAAGFSIRAKRIDTGWSTLVLIRRP